MFKGLVVDKAMAEKKAVLSMEATINAGEEPTRWDTVERFIADQVQAQVPGWLVVLQWDTSTLVVHKKHTGVKYAKPDPLTYDWARRIAQATGYQVKMLADCQHYDHVWSTF